jgi:ribose transport system substrate-binding protein
MSKPQFFAGRRLTLAACLGAAGILAASCSSGHSTAGSSTNSTGVAGHSGHRWNITAVMANITDPYFITMECGAKHQAKLSNVNLTWTGATTADVPTEVRNLQTAVLSNPDAIFQTPFDPTAFVSPVRQVMQQGIPYLMVDGALDQPVAWKYVVTQHTNLEHLVGDPIAKAMGGKGTIGILADAPNNEIDRIRYAGWVAGFKTAYPNIKVLSPQYVSSDTAKAATATAAMIQGNPDLTAIFASNGPELDGAVSAVEAAGKVGKIQLFGYAAAVTQDLNNVRRGIVTGIWAQSPYQEGVMAIKLLTSYLNAHGAHHGPVQADSQPYEINTPLAFIDKSNVDAPQTKPFYGLTSADGPTC